MLVSFREEIILTLLAFALIFAITAAYLSGRNWARWRNIETDTMKARAFLDSSFLDVNFKLTLFTVGVVGGLVSAHVVMEYLELTGYASDGFYVIYYSLLPVATFSLVLMAYMWHRLLQKN